MLGLLRKLPVKLMTIGVVIATASMAAVLGALEALGFGQQVADLIGPRVMREAALWVFSTPAWVPSLVWLVAAFLLFLLVRTSLKTDMEFLRQAEESRHTKAVLSAAQKVVWLRSQARVLHLMEVRLVEEADRIANWARTEMAPAGSPFATSNNARPKQFADDALNGANAALSAHSLRDEPLDAALIGKDLTRPVPWEGVSAFIGEKAREGREYFYKFEYMMSRVRQALAQIDAQTADLDREMGIQP